MKNKNIAKVIWLIIGVSLAIHLLSYIIGNTLLEGWRWAHVPFHSSIEMSGSLIALLVATFLVIFERANRGTHYNMQIAAALIAMGLLDGFHAIVHEGNTFVWLHSVATFAGGILFVTILFPTHWKFPRSVKWPLITLIIVLGIGSNSLLFPDILPLMVQQGKFTLAAMLLNIFGGVLLFVSAFRLIQEYFHTQNTDDLLFCLHCSLFGAAAAMFELSVIWDAPWWGWHILRFLAYLVALWFVVISGRNIISDLITETTERKQAEESLQKSEARFHDVAISMSDWIWEVDAQAKYTYVSGSVKEILGYDKEELLGITPFDLMPQEEAKRVDKIFTEISANKRPIVDLENWNLTKDGREVCLLTNGVPMLDNEGKLLGYRGVDKDITERKKIEERHMKMQKLESIGVLAGGIAHDFNNNLQSIMSYVDLAKSYTNPEDEVYGKLEEAKTVVLQSKSLTQQLLTFSKGGEPVKNTISISKLIKDSANLALSGSNVRCELVIPDDLWPVEADKGQLNQGISNLIINADQAMPEGGNIKVWAENINVVEKDLLPLQTGRYVKITIKDQGKGISHEHLQKIFDPYFTTKEMGSGLGLATVFSIIKKHGGYITAESELEAGTTFHVYLPVSKEETQQEPILDKAKVRSAEEASIMCKGKILLMDDELLISKSVGQQLRNLKYEIETVKNGTEAIEVYKGAMELNNPFNAVIMDLTIPGGMGGKETIKKLLEIDPDVKAIIASGYSNDPVMAEFKKHGFKGAVHKPYGIDELEEVLQKVITEKEEC